jgi:hypothetical protein
VNYRCTITEQIDIDAEVDVHDGHAYLTKATWNKVDVLPAILASPDLLHDIEERIWQRWFNDTREGL